MPAGVSTSPEVEAEFRAHYLYSGNAAESAREVGIPERTGRDLAKRLQADEAFAADRRSLRTRALDELVAMRMRVAHKAVERFESDQLDVGGGGENVTVIDKRADYGRLVIEAEKAAQHLAKVDAPEAAERPPVTINIVRAVSANGDGDPDPDDGSGA